MWHRPSIALVPLLVVALAQPATSHADGSAQIAFGGNVAFGPAGTLTLEIGGAAPGTEHDRLDVAGDAALDGAVDLVPIGGFAPAPGASFTLVTWATISMCA